MEQLLLPIRSLPKSDAAVMVVTAAVVGYLCIRLLKFIAEKGRFGAFAYYCWAVGVLTLVLQGIK